MKITFILPSPTRKIAGGYKMVYEYSNRLVNKGHRVDIVYHIGRQSFFKKIEKYIRSQIEPKWFDLNSKIQKKIVCNIDNNSISDSDVIIVTSYGSSKSVSELDKSKGRKYYFIQDFENWGITDKEVYESYDLGMANIVISKWLGSIVNRISTSVYIPNGIDFEIFNISKKIETRESKSIAMLYHIDDRKDSKLGLKVIEKVREKYPNLKVNLFGCPKRPSNIPKDYIYIQKANQYQLKDLYNKSAIFLCTSKVEGFGLTGAESMACGCALVSTNCKGVLEYAEHEKTALISEVGNYVELYKNIIRMLENNDYRIGIAKQGYNEIKKLDWNLSVDKFENYLKNKELI